MVRLLEGSECQLSNGGYYQCKCKLTTKYQDTKKGSICLKRQEHIPSYLQFFLSGIHSMQDWTATPLRCMVLKEKETKRLKHTGNLFTSSASSDERLPK